MAKTNVDGPSKVYNNRLHVEKSKKIPKSGGAQKQRKRTGARNAILSSSRPKNIDPEAGDADAYDEAAIPLCARQHEPPLAREMRPSTSSSASVGPVRILENHNAANPVTRNGPQQVKKNKQ